MPEDPIQMLGCYITAHLPPDERTELMEEFQDGEEAEEEYEEDTV